MYQNIPTKVLTGEVRLSYAHLVTPEAPKDGGEPKYSVTLLIPKSDNATLLDINASMQAAYEDGVVKKWGGAHPQLNQIMWDGDGLRKSGLPFGDECKGHWVITASSYQKPQVVGIDNINCELAPNDIYSGMYARVTINFYPFDANGNKGVGCGLGNVLKIRDGEPLSGGASAASDFEGIGASPQPGNVIPQYGSAVPMQNNTFAQPGNVNNQYGNTAPVQNNTVPQFGNVPQNGYYAAPSGGIDPITGKPM